MPSPQSGNREWRNKRPTDTRGPKLLQAIGTMYGVTESVPLTTYTLLSTHILSWALSNTECESNAQWDEHVDFLNDRRPAKQLPNKQATPTYFYLLQTAFLLHFGCKRFVTFV